MRATLLRAEAPSARHRRGLRTTDCQLAGFCAGCADGDAFTFIVTVLATFHLGLRVSPSVVTPATGAFDPERVLTAFRRGRRLRVDLMGRWNYWALMPLPISPRPRPKSDDACSSLV